MREKATLIVHFDRFITPDWGFLLREIVATFSKESEVWQSPSIPHVLVGREESVKTKIKYKKQQRTNKQKITFPGQNWTRIYAELSLMSSERPNQWRDWPDLTLPGQRFCCCLFSFGLSLPWDPLHAYAYSTWDLNIFILIGERDVKVAGQRTFP